MDVSWQFAMPALRDELLVEEPGRYHVKRRLLAQDIARELGTVKGSVRKRWSWWSVEHFDTFYSVITKFTSLEGTVQCEAWRLAVAGLEQHTETLGRLLTSDQGENGRGLEGRAAHLNALQMGVWIVVELVGCFEAQARGVHIVTAKKSKVKRDSDIWGEGERQEGMAALRQILDLNIAMLWDPPVVTSSFVDQIADCCYKLLERAETVKCKKTLESVLHVLAILIKRYNHSMGASLKLQQLLQVHEHAGPAAAALVLLCLRDYDVRGLLGLLVREIAGIEPAELARDTAATRHYCLFLSEVAGSCGGAALLPLLSSLLPHLDGDSYAMRNAVLSILGEVLAGPLDNPDTRDTLLDRLEAHVHDTNAFVRSRAVQVLGRLVEGRAVPVARQGALLRRVVGAAQDRSSNVRRSAMAFLRSSLRCNPFAEQQLCSLEELKEKVGSEREKLVALEKGQEGVQDAEVGEEGGGSQEEERPREEDEGLRKQRVIVRYLEDCVHFTEQLHTVIELVTQLLASKTTSDVLESIELLVSAREFGMKIAEPGIRKMLVLVFSSEQSVRDAVVSAYLRLYIRPENGKSMKADVVAGHLIGMVPGATLAELASLGELVKLLLEKEHINPRVIKCLLDLLLDKAADSKEQSSAAVVLAMVAAVDPSVAEQNLALLASAGLAGDVNLAQNTCKLLQEAATVKDFVRLEPSHRVPTSLVSKLLDTLSLPNVDWMAFADVAIKAIFVLCEDPQQTVSGLLGRMLEQTGEEKAGGRLIERLLSVVGQVALCSLVYLESLPPPTEEVEEDEEAQGEEALRSVTPFLPLVTHIASSPELFPCPRIQNAAAVALCKAMLASRRLCERHLQLVFTLLEKSQEEGTRCNIMVLLHDMIIRFPNLLVNWTDKVYARLKDPSSRVRCTTVRTLTNLILNDMVKVKGNISQLARCLEDEEPRIRSLTKLFFSELSHKPNAIYNVLPDLISHLSDPAEGRDREQFERIMRFLFEFVDKDKQKESLVEKLCHRLRATRCDSQWHDMSYCLTLITYTERSIKRLLENLACYQDKLSDTTVHENFTLIIEKSRKVVKNEELLTDLEERVAACHGRLNNSQASQGSPPPTRPSQKAAPRSVSRPSQRASKQQRRRRKTKRQMSSEESSGGSSDDFEIKTVPQLERNTRRLRR